MIDIINEMKRDKATMYAINRMTQREIKGRQSLQQRKPKVWQKVQKFPEKVARGQSIALVQLQYNYMCNFNCKHCAIARFKEQNRPTLTVKDVKKIADEADAMGLASICISGGEPLLFPDLKQIVDAIGPDRFVISIDTNGSLLTEEKVKWLVDIGVDRIHLSIDGLESNHNAFRKVEGSWSKAINALDYCKKHGLGVIINVVVTKSLIKSGQLIKQMDFVSQFGFHTSMIYAKATGAFESFKDEVLDTKDFEYLKTLHKQNGGKYDSSEHLSANHGFDFGCLCFKRHMSITAHGDVLPCPWIPISMGNVLQKSFSSIVERGLQNTWFSYDRKFGCLSGNCDGLFFKQIMPQAEHNETYPTNWEDIDWLI